MAAWPLVQQNDSGEDVRSVQYLLNAHGAALATDGLFGPLTKGAVQSFQTSHGLIADGIVGNATWPQLIITVAVGASNPAVSAVQSQLHARIARPTVDGIFGPETDGVVRDFQQAAGLVVDGIVGPNTWNALVSGVLGASDAVDAAQRVFAAWEANDPTTARKNATSIAVTELFARSWTAAAGWTYKESSGALGSVGSTWDNASGGSLTIVVNNNLGAPFFYATYVIFT